ncbi:Small ubiquitin- modifier 2 [Turnera subulata]|uniref:Small ubiquitin- modifier 2 n=1 Tax=Turnera subulata TaxID=218843 RepID=A0A9Q0GN21_9ROSI|nr:Small ubiquitin- modifier 2 [Turnera subulata]
MSGTGGAGGSGSGQEEHNKPQDQFGAQMILIVRGVQGVNDVFFRIRPSTQLRKLMYAYCDRHSVEFGSFAFLFDGRRIFAHQTPEELEMEDGDTIDAMPSIGGPCPLCARSIGGPCQWCTRRLEEQNRWRESISRV